MHKFEKVECHAAHIHHHLHETGHQQSEKRINHTGAYVLLDGRRKGGLRLEQAAVEHRQECM